VLAEHALPAGALELDVSESHAAQCDQHAIAALHALRARGVRVAIDDFGTGFSSVTRLRAFPVDSLKSDTEGVRELSAATRDARVARAVIALARALGLSVTAEGVENVHQLEILREQRCEAWQGYLCAEPLAEEAVFETMGRKRRAYR
jgi:EAL domain-containing protein (putative c-di-GMP-specific phosphodiesterase class I)